MDGIPWHRERTNHQTNSDPDQTKVANGDAWSASSLSANRRNIERPSRLGQFDGQLRRYPDDPCSPWSTLSLTTDIDTLGSGSLAYTHLTSRKAARTSDPTTVDLQSASTSHPSTCQTSTSSTRQYHSSSDGSEYTEDSWESDPVKNFSHHKWQEDERIAYLFGSPAEPQPTPFTDSRLDSLAPVPSDTFVGYPFTDSTVTATNYERPVKLKQGRNFRNYQDYLLARRIGACENCRRQKIKCEPWHRRSGSTKSPETEQTSTEVIVTKSGAEREALYRNPVLDSDSSITLESQKHGEAHSQAIKSSQTSSILAREFTATRFSPAVERFLSRQGRCILVKAEKEIWHLPNVGAGQFLTTLLGGGSERILQALCKGLKKSVLHPAGIRECAGTGEKRGAETYNKIPGSQSSSNSEGSRSSKKPCIRPSLDDDEPEDNDHIPKQVEQPSTDLQASKEPRYHCHFCARERNRYYGSDLRYTVCARSPGLQGRLIKEHIQTVHSQQKRCGHCGEKWTASQSEEIRRGDIKMLERHESQCASLGARGDRLPKADLLSLQQERDFQKRSNWPGPQGAGNYDNLWHAVWKTLWPRENQPAIIRYCGLVNLSLEIRPGRSIEVLTWRDDVIEEITALNTRPTHDRWQSVEVRRCGFDTSTAGQENGHPLQTDNNTHPGIQRSLNAPHQDEVQPNFQFSGTTSSSQAGTDPSDDLSLGLLAEHGYLPSPQHGEQLAHCDITMHPFSGMSHHTGSKTHSSQAGGGSADYLSYGPLTENLYSPPQQPGEQSTQPAMTANSSNVTDRQLAGIPPCQPSQSFLDRSPGFYPGHIDAFQNQQAPIPAAGLPQTQPPFAAQGAPIQGQNFGALQDLIGIWPSASSHQEYLRLRIGEYPSTDESSIMAVIGGTTSHVDPNIDDAIKRTYEDILGDAELMDLITRPVPS